MIIVSKGEHTIMPVGGALVGKRIDEIRLRLEDVARLASLTPEQLHSLIGTYWLNRFPAPARSFVVPTLDSIFKPKPQLP